MDHDGPVRVRLLHRRPPLAGLAWLAVLGSMMMISTSSRDGLEQAPAALVSRGDLNPDGAGRRRQGAVDGAVVPVEERGHLPGELLAGAAGCAL